MNDAERLELHRLEQDQAELRLRMRELDQRLAALTQALVSEELKAQVTSKPPRPIPAPGASVAPPPLPTQLGGQRVVVHPPDRREQKSEVLQPPIADAVTPPAKASPTSESQPAPEALSARVPQPVPLPKGDSIELRVGSYWMARIGIVLLLTGLVFLGNYAYHRIVPLLGPWGKLTLLALAGGALAAGGAALERSRETLRNYGRVLLAGGAATLYYTVYASHFVERLRVTESPVLGGALLLAMAGGFMWYADRRRSEAVALPAVLLAYYTSAINAIGTFTLFSNLLLTAAAVFFLIRRRWMRLSYASLVATYGSYAFWRFHHWVQTGATGSEFGPGLAFVVGYWVLFTAAVFLAAPAAMPPALRVTFLTINNGAFFAFAAQLFAIHQPLAFWWFATAFGAVLLGLAALAARLRPEQRSLDGAYLAQGLVFGTIGLMTKLAGPQLAILFAVESAVVLTGIRRRQSQLCEIAGALFAMGACAQALGDLRVTEVHPFVLGGPVAGLLIFDAWWVKRRRGELERFSEFAFIFAVLGLLVLSKTLWETVAPPWEPAAFALTACLGLGTLRVRALREVAFLAQAFLAIGAGVLIGRSFELTPEPWWSPLPLVLAALGLMHWWQHQRAVELTAQVRTLAQILCAAAAAITAACWMRCFFEQDAWLIATSAAAVGTLGYALATRGWAIAVVGQLFTALSICEFVLRFGKPHWAAALAPIVNLIACSAVARRCASRAPGPPLLATDLSKIAQGYGILAFALLGAWSFRYIHSEWRVAFFAGFGAAQMLFGAFTRNAGRTRIGAVYAAAGMVLFWVDFGHRGYWADLFALVAIPASLRLGQRLAGIPPLMLEARNALVIAAVASLWLWVTRWIHLLGYSGQLTAAWAVLALLVFAAGLGLRERIYRLGGFAILALALGRFVILDVWRFETVYRVVSAMVLGAVLLLLSFIYSRFADTFRRWL